LEGDHDHRYLMLGIPGIGPGNGFESVRTNLIRSSGYVDIGAVLIYDQY